MVIIWTSEITDGFQVVVGGQFKYRASLIECVEVKADSKDTIENQLVAANEDGWLKFLEQNF